MLARRKCKNKKLKVSRLKEDYKTTFICKCHDHLCRKSKGIYKTATTLRISEFSNVTGHKIIMQEVNSSFILISKNF